MGPSFTASRSHITLQFLTSSCTDRINVISFQASTISMSVLVSIPSASRTKGKGNSCSEMGRRLSQAMLQAFSTIPFGGPVVLRRRVNARSRTPKMGLVSRWNLGNSRKSQATTFNPSLRRMARTLKTFLGLTVVLLKSIRKDIGISVTLSP